VDPEPHFCTFVAPVLEETQRRAWGSMPRLKSGITSKIILAKEMGEGGV